MKKYKVTCMDIKTGDVYDVTMSEGQFLGFEQTLIDGTSEEFMLNCEEIKED